MLTRTPESVCFGAFLKTGETIQADECLTDLIKSGIPIESGITSKSSQEASLFFKAFVYVLREREHEHG